MLRHVTLHLATQYTTVSMVARTQRRLETLSQEISANNGYLHDYRDTTALQTQLQSAAGWDGYVNRLLDSFCGAGSAFRRC
ncbi:MAG: hypothetical protein GFH27_549293n13 [Chloroflexi bacterium AL-W]|nr:hypothetical protein [Chloroflexi bacterium AL-N1]NOK67872.1 hypothetical protein [Chloroflexi bacterium AL-N10]NOK75358.1 hypothetical protein [Chloroflexi bacterium AL-N5]NOK82146.1 hypothetical protein [Chloroflexi bacterium AL-W]NOK89991.1 hypothetical protein [Chloroflexi bacterium AL-N15]